MRHIIPIFDHEPKDITAELGDTFLFVVPEGPFADITALGDGDIPADRREAFLSAARAGGLPVYPDVQVRDPAGVLENTRIVTATPASAAMGLLSPREIYGIQNGMQLILVYTAVKPGQAQVTTSFTHAGVGHLSPWTITVNN
jgi:hypothetical protein